MSDAEAAVMKKIEAIKSPYAFPGDQEWTDVDCAAIFNMEESQYSTWTLIQLIANLLNIDSGDPL